MARKPSNRKEKDEPKKKRKVGRPKKRGRKKNYYKAKKKQKVVSKKGFSSNVTYNRVRHVIWENHKEDFPSYRAFISNQVDENGQKIKGTSIVSRVFNECKSLECNDEDILAIYRQFKEQKKDDNPPKIPQEYYNNPYGYWNILNLDFWNGMEERLWVVSSDLLVDPDYFLGVLGNDIYVNEDGEKISFDEYEKGEGRLVQGKKWRFQEWVNWCNSLQLQRIVLGSDEVPHFRFAGIDDFTNECYWNETYQRWEVRIISCRKTGEPETYNYIPEEPDLIDTGKIEDVLSKKPVEKEEEKGVSEVDKQLQLKKAEAEIEQAKLKQEEERTAQKRLEVEKEKIELEKGKIQREIAIIDLFARGKIDQKKMDEMLKNLK